MLSGDFCPFFSCQNLLVCLTKFLQEGPALKSKGKASCGTRIAVLTWRSLLIMSREWKYYWLRLILCMLLTLCVGTVFSGLGHSLSSVGVSSLKLWIYVIRLHFNVLWKFIRFLISQGTSLLCGLCLCYSLGPLPFIAL